MVEVEDIVFDTMTSTTSNITHNEAQINESLEPGYNIQQLFYKTIF